MKSLLTTTLIACLSLTAVNAQVSLVLQPGMEDGKDAMIGNYFTYTDLNFGDWTEWDAWAWTSGGANTDMRALIDFNLSSIPPGSVIVKAVLTLYYDGDTWFGGGVHSGANAATLSRITSPWTEMGVTWNTQPTITAMHAVSVPASTSPTQDYNLNIKKLVQDYVDHPESSYGFYLKLNSEDPYRSLLFCSSEHADNTKHPRLKIIYMPPAPKVSLNAQQPAITIAPNPFTISATVSFNYLPENEYRFELYNLNGELVFGENVISDNMIINRNNMPSGIYLYRLITNGTVTDTGKIAME